MGNNYMVKVALKFVEIKIDYLINSFGIITSHLKKNKARILMQYF